MTGSPETRTARKAAKRAGGRGGAGHFERGR